LQQHFPLTTTTTTAFNLQQNDELRGQVARGEIPAYALVEMKPEELATKDIKQMRQGLVVVYKTKQEQRMETSIQAGVKNAGISMYTCPKCESRNCDSFAMQTRGADEPMTIFCTCLDCGQAFRGGNDQAGHD
jgi:transcription elongation factor S-II|tara:strand:+ start:34 stop:432 length:399 start_codon:yes stop_codon:yes gene_type:complete